MGSTHFNALPSHRVGKKPLSILKKKKMQVGKLPTNSNLMWDYAARDESSSENNYPPRTSPTITQSPFFEIKEVTNCEFIYDSSEKSEQARNQGGNFFSRLFARANMGPAEISCMSAIRDLLVIGFTNGVLILFDVEKLEICFTHKNFTKHSKPIDKLFLFSCELRERDDPNIVILLSLSDGCLTYHSFPKI
jgi:hypothetical protein